jgi:uncharacterized DUF497 family protein
MDFEWDESKTRRNERKHGVTFHEATEVFGDDCSSCVLDPDHSRDEERYLLFGMSARGNHLVVAFTERPNAIRIISARRMTPSERKAYEQ